MGQVIRIPLSGMGGVHQDMNPSEANPIFATALSNINLVKNNSLKSATGYSERWSAAGSNNYPCIGVFNAKFMNDAEALIACFGDSSGGLIYKDDHDSVRDSLNTVSGGTTPTIKGPDLYTFANTFDSSGNEIIVASNGKAAPFKITKDFEMDVLGGSPYWYKYIVEWKGYLWGANVTNDGSGNTHPNYLCLSSERNAEEHFNGYYTIPFPRAITGIMPFAGRLWVFTEGNVLWSIAGYDYDTFKNMDIADVSVGCKSNSSIIVANRMMFWRGQDGFYVMDYSFNPQNISTERLRDTETVFGKDTIDRISGFVNTDNEEVVWFIAGTANKGYSDTRLRFNYTKKAWIVDEGFNVEASCSWIDSSKGKVKMIIGNGSGNDKLYDVTGSDADGSGLKKYIQWLINGANISEGLAPVRKKFHHVEIEVEATGSHDLTFTWEVGDHMVRPEDAPADTSDVQYGSFTVTLTPTGSVYGTALYGTAKYNEKGIKHFLKEILATGRYMKLRIENDNADEDFKILAVNVVVEIVEKPVQRGYGDIA